MVRSAAVSAVAFLLFANPSFALETSSPAGRPVAALIGEPSIDPSAQPLVIELETRATSEPVVIAAAPLMVPASLWTPGPYGAWDLDAPDRRSAMRFTLSGAFPENAAVRFEAPPIQVQARRAA